MRAQMPIDRQITVGVDTHADQHVGVALDQLGRFLGTQAVPSTAAGHAALLAWARRFGVVERIGIEGTGSDGAGLCRWLRARGVAVVEVERPKRPERRGRGTSDPVDAEAAARAVQAGTATAQPKAGTGLIESIRALHATRRSAMKARTQAANQLHALVVTAPDDLRARLRRLGVARLVAAAAAFRPRAPRTPAAATKLALKSIAVRYRRLTAEIEALDAHLSQLVAAAAPDLVALKGVGTDTAATLLVTAGDNPDRLRSEGSFAHLCGVASIPAGVHPSDQTSGCARSSYDEPGDRTRPRAQACGGARVRRANRTPARRRSASRAQPDRAGRAAGVGEHGAPSSDGRRHRARPGQLRLELRRRPVAQRRVQTLGVVHVVDEPGEVALRVRERPVLLEVHLLGLEGLEERLGPGVLVRVAGAGHADPGAGRPQPGHVGRRTESVPEPMIPAIAPTCGSMSLAIYNRRGAGVPRGHFPDRQHRAELRARLRRVRW
jgi:hypothetical protein